MLLSETFPGDVVTVSSDTTVAHATRKMKDQNVGAVVVVNDRKVVGILTDRDVALKVVAGNAAPDSPVNEVMTKDPLTIWDDDDLGILNATQQFAGHKVRRLPIVDRQDHIVGMLTIDDLFALFAREMFNVAHALEPSLGDRV